MQTNELGESGGRVSRLVILLFLACTLLACGGSPLEERSMRPQVDHTLPDSELDVAATLAQLDAHLARLGAKAGAPISDADLARLTPLLPCKLPPLLEQIYRWHDGVAPLTPGYDLLPLAEVLKQYRQIRDLDQELGMSDTDGGWPRTYLPILEFDSKEYIALDCTGGALFHNFNEDPSWDPRYRGLGHFLKVTLSAYESGAYRMHRGYFDQVPISLAEAYRAHALPGELEAFEHNWQQIDQALRTGSGHTFLSALEWAKRFPDARHVSVLIQRLDEKDPLTLSRVAFTLGDFRAQAAEPALAKLLNHPAVEVRNLAASALSELDHLAPETVGRLIKLLDDQHDMVRISAIEALETAGSKTAVTPLLQLLTRSRPGIQAYVVSTLGELQDPQALGALRRLREQVAAQDQAKPERGGTRGSDPTPRRLLEEIDEAISKIGP